jgi:hypothetical protein
MNRLTIPMPYALRLADPGDVDTRWNCAAIEGSHGG